MSPQIFFIILLLQAAKHNTEKKLIECELKHQKEMDAVHEKCEKLKEDLQRQTDISENLRKDLEQNSAQRTPQIIGNQVTATKKSLLESVSRLHKNHRKEVLSCG